MPIYRCQKTRQFFTYTIMAARDPRISFKAKGVLSLMLSYPDTWRFSVQHIAGISKEGQGAIRAALRELEKYGYLKAIEKRDNYGRIAGIEYEVYDIPQIIPPELVNLLPNGEPCEDAPIERLSEKGARSNKCKKVKTPKVENPHTDKSETENPHMENGANSKTYLMNNVQYINPSISELKAEVMDAIDYEILKEECEPSLLANVVSVMANTLHSTKPYIRVGGEDYPTAEVQSQLRVLRADHIRYVLDSIDAAASPISNIRSYLLTSLYNAASTMEIYYRTKAKHDLIHGDYIDRCRDLLDKNDEEG